MNYERSSSGQNQGSQWDALREVPFQERTDAEESPFEDSMHYWAPEMHDGFDGANMGRPVPPMAPERPRQERPAERRANATQRAESARNYEQEIDASSRAKVINYLGWRALQTRMDDEDSDFRKEFIDIMTAPNPTTDGEAAEEAILYDIRDGVFGEEDEKFLLEHLMPPEAQNGVAATLNSLATRHERRFLSNFTSAGFDGYNGVTEQNLSEFMQKYPTPVDFMDDAKDFVLSIRAGSGQRKGDEYQVAMESFMNKIYGKRYKYYKQFEALKEEANGLPDDYEAMGEKLPENIGLAGIARSTVAAVRNFVISDAQGLTNQEFAIRMREEILKYRGEGADKSQDSVLINRERQVYGIFDGAGGVDGGQAASRLASRVANSFAKQYQLGDARQLANVLTLTGAKLVQAERNGREIGVTTGAIAQVVDTDDGFKRLAFASVGDSRIYIVHADGETEQVTQDEGYEKYIENYLGRGQDREHDDAGIMRRDTNTGRTENVTQYGTRGLIRGDRIVICSDGITGDKGSDVMSREELGYYVSASATAKDAAENLLGYARKVDDRSVIVVDAYPPKTSVVDGFLKRFLRK